MSADPLVPQLARGWSAAGRKALHCVRRLPSVLARQHADCSQARHQARWLIRRRHPSHVRRRTGAVACGARQLSAHGPDACASVRREDPSDQPAAGAHRGGAFVRTRAHRCARRDAAGQVRKHYANDCSAAVDKERARHGPLSRPTSAGAAYNFCPATVNRVSDVATPGPDEHAVTPLELFFDLVFVFAITQVTGFLSHDPTWGGLMRGLLVLSAVWWAWSGYTWLGSTLDVDEGVVRLALLVAMAAMLGVGLAVPHAFGRDALLFGCAYLLVRAMHLSLYAFVGRGDPDLLRAVTRVLPPMLLGAGMILAAAFLHGDARLALWLGALAVEYAAPPVLGLHGWRIAPEHFAERFGLVVL